MKQLDMGDKLATRLSDRILFALELALEQGDVSIAETLTRALEMSMTRNTGGGEFVERRDYPLAMEEAMKRLNELRKDQAEDRA
ncbi:MAG: hypothetical protein HYU57_04280 [Micavibrio aeruginosavorus]|nr:hypothetical protein [Micavibrio aeruginosavorus]